MQQALEIEREAEQAGNSQFLSFMVEGASYGVNLMEIKEIRGWSETTRIPNAPDYMRGVINLRGQVIPIFDLRTRFGMGRTEPTEKHVVIVLGVGSRTVGVLVDAVSDILNVSQNEIKPSPSAHETHVDDAYVSGLIAKDKKMVVILNVEHLFGAEMLKQADKLVVNK